MPRCPECGTSYSMLHASCPKCGGKAAVLPDPDTAIDEAINRGSGERDKGGAGTSEKLKSEESHRVLIESSKDDPDLLGLDQQESCRIVGESSSALAGPSLELAFVVQPVDWISLIRAFRREPILRKAEVVNRGSVRYEDLRVTIEFGEFAESQVFMVPVLNSGKSMILAQENCTLSYNLAAFRKITEKSTVRLTVSLQDSDGKLLLIKHFDIPVLAYNECPIDPGDAALIACYVQPSDPAVQDIVQKAITYLETLNSDFPGFMGYQVWEYERQGLNPNMIKSVIDNQVHAVYFAIQKNLGIRYINPPPSYESSSFLLQRLRTPSQICHEQQGTCFDLSVLFAASLAYIGLHPVIFLVRGHALFGYYTRPIFLSHIVVEDWAYVTNLINAGELVAINSTDFTGGKTYAESRMAGQYYVAKRENAKEDFSCAIDITQARQQGFLPMALEE